MDINISVRFYRFDSSNSSFLCTVAYYNVDNGALIWMVSSVETNVGIIFTCMHAIRPILSQTCTQLLFKLGVEETYAEIEDLD